MLLAMAVPSILDAIIAELQKLRREAAAGGIKKPFGGDRADRTIALTPRAEEKLFTKEEDRGVERQRLITRA